MRYSFILALICFALGLSPAVQAQLLIFKQTEGVLKPLDAHDIAKDGDALAAILLKYEWPMCIASELSKEDQDALLVSNVSYAEELFIQNKINEQFDQYKVAFIPTCLFELFVITQLFATKGQKNPLQNFINKIMMAKYGTELKRQWIIDITKKINAESDDFKSLANVRREINAVYKKINDSVYKGKESLYFYINGLLTAKLLGSYADLQGQDTSLMVSKIIKKHSNQLLSLLVSEFLALYDVSNPQKLWLPHIGGHEERNNINEMALLIKKEKEDGIISNVMNLEYEARDLNKGLLIRGTTFESFAIGLSFPKNNDQDVQFKHDKKVLAGSSVLREERDLRVKNHQPISLEHAYWKGQNMPYSISFGNSLFAGVLRDHLASAYHYLAKRKTNRKSIGYALFIDKEDYYLHNTSNLFFIPSIAPLAALFERGEYFHARSKAAVVFKEGKKHEVRGLIGHKLSDPAGVILITRDPLRHAELFSKFLVQNGRIIQVGDMNDLTHEEQLFAHEAIHSQKQAAQFYRNLRNITPVLKDWIKSRSDQNKENSLPNKENNSN